MKITGKMLNISAVLLFCLAHVVPVWAKPSNISGSEFPGTCAEKMKDVPYGDAPWDKSESEKSYVTAQWYKDAVAGWQSKNLVQITVADVSKDVLGLPIYTSKETAVAFTNFGKDLLNCEEFKQGLYEIKIYDHFTCRLITPGSTSNDKQLSNHAFGNAIDFNVNSNLYKKGGCKPEYCDFSPCFLAALKKNGLSWGGPGNPMLYPGVCDTQHIEWTGKGSNITDQHLKSCEPQPQVAAIYKDTSTTPTGGTVGTPAQPATPVTLDEIGLILNKPQLKINIPGISGPDGFSNIQAVEEQGGKFLYIPFLGEYIAAVYKYGVVIASIFAIVMIIYQGFRWVTSSGSPEKISHAKTRILQCIVGLSLAVGSYVLLYTINPKLVSFGSMRVQYIPGIPLSDEEGLQSTFGADNPNVYEGYVSTGQAGQWRYLALNNCGGKNGLSLQTKTDKVARLKSIVKLWKNLAVDQGAGLYIHGGSLDCNPRLGGTSLIYTITSIHQSRPGAVPSTFLNTVCGKAVSEASASFITDKSINNRYYKNKSIAGSKLDKVPNKPQCEKDLLTVYKTLLSEPAKKSGLMCGDCGSFILSLYNCFDSHIESKHTRRFVFEGKIVPTADKTVIKFHTELKNIINNPVSFINKLEFGDILNWYRPDIGGNHYFLYTGKGGFDFEIMEMGAAGSAKPDQNSAQSAFQKIGLFPPYSGSGVRTFKSAQEYLTKLGGSSAIITAYSVIDQKI